MRTSALFGKKISDYSKLVVCPHGQEGEGELSLCGQFFVISCRRPIKILKCSFYLVISKLSKGYQTLKGDLALLEDRAQGFSQRYHPNSEKGAEIILYLF